MKNVTSNQSHTYDIVSFFYCFCQRWAILSAFIYTFINMCKLLFL